MLSSNSVGLRLQSAAEAQSVNRCLAASMKSRQGDCAVA
jgi:hypothetical protein